MDWERLRVELRQMLGIQEDLRPVFPTISEILQAKPEFRSRVLEKMDEYEMAVAPKIKVYERTTDVLELLSARARVALVTMQGRSVVDYLFSRANIGRYFYSSFTRDVSTDRTRQLEMALASMGLQSADAVFIADRLNDLNSARALAMRFVMVRGYNDPDGLAAYSDMASFHAALLGEEPLKLSR